MVSEVSLEWLCDENSKPSEKYQIEICAVDKCRTYDEWSSWTPCSKICGGFRSRSRSCKAGLTNQALCDPKYLSEINECSNLDDCTSTIISKYI